jgi:hypothetical protein
MMRPVEAGMSEEEESVAIVRLLKKRSEARRRKVLLDDELRTASGSLTDIGTALRHLIITGPYSNVDTAISKLNKAPKVCGLESVKALLVELKAVEDTISYLNNEAKAYDID